MKEKRQVASTHRKKENIVGLDSGFSIASILVAIGVLGVLAVVASNVIVQGIERAKKVSEKGDIEDLRTLVRASIDCKETAANRPVNCAPNTLIALYNSKSKVFVGIPNVGSSGPSTIGPFSLQAKCGAIKNSIDIEYSTKNKKNEWQKLFTGVPFICI